MCQSELTEFLAELTEFAADLSEFSLPKIRNFPVTPTPSIFPKVLPYKWEAYCSTNGRCTVGFPFLQGLEARKVQQYKWGAYCRTNWRCTAVLSSRPVGVGVSETLLKKGNSRNSIPPVPQLRRACSSGSLPESEADIKTSQL